MAVIDQQLVAFFRNHTSHTALLAYSGGLDSHVLLHVLTRLKAAHPTVIPAIRALHVNHGLQAVSADWAVHCQAVCAALEVELTLVELDLQIPAGSSVEAAARDARYQALQADLQPGEVLLTAHHQDDQAETLLLNLLRGSGPEGLAAMPEKRPFAKTSLLRPLLSLSRTQLQDYAHAFHLHWIDDPSNQSLVFDRNYLRHAVLPVLCQRWPAATALLARAAHWQGENVTLMQDLLTERLLQAHGAHTGTLSVKALLKCRPELQRALLRQWIKQAGFKAPSLKKIQHILSDVLPAKADAQPCIHWDGCEIRRYRDDLYVLSPLPLHDPHQVTEWPAPYQPPVAAQNIPALHALDKQVLGGLLPLLIQRGATLQIRFRHGGEKLFRSGRYITLKQFLQDKAIPPWQRERLPLIYLGEQLIILPGIFELSPEDLDKTE